MIRKMKERLKKIYYLTESLFKTVVSLFSILLFSNGSIARKISEEKKKNIGHSISVLAGGPSVKEILVEKRELLKHTDLLVLNNFANNEIFFELKPKYYIILDPAYYDPIVKVESERNADDSRQAKRQLLENLMRVDWDMTLFLPYVKNAKKELSLFAVNKNINVVEYNKTRVLGFENFQNWMYKHNMGIPSSRNVIIPAMILLANLGYSQIYLYGCEFSWTKTMDVNPENGMMFFNDRHFYSEKEIRYFGKGGYRWWLEAIVEMLFATEQVAKYAHSLGIKIVNRTKCSFIDAFVYENPDAL